MGQTSFCLLGNDVTGGSQQQQQPAAQFGRWKFALDTHVDGWGGASGEGGFGPPPTAHASAAAATAHSTAHASTGGSSSWRSVSGSLVRRGGAAGDGTAAPAAAGGSVGGIS